MLEWREPFQSRRRYQLKALSWHVSINFPGAVMLNQSRHYFRDEDHENRI